MMTHVWYVNEFGGELTCKPIVKCGPRFVYVPRDFSYRNVKLDRWELEATGSTYASRLHTTVYRSREMAETQLPMQRG